MDPKKDVHVMVEDGVLRIKVERSREQRTEDGKPSTPNSTTVRSTAMFRFRRERARTR